MTYNVFSGTLNPTHSLTHSRYRLCVEFADKMLIFAVLERWLLQLRETDSSFVFIIIFLETAVIGCFEASHDEHGPLFWTAGQRIDPSYESTFVWRVTSTDTHSDRMSVMTYDNWGSGQPSYHHQGHSCALIQLFESYTWNDFPCSAKVCFICELDMEA